MESEETGFLLAIPSPKAHPEFLVPSSSWERAKREALPPLYNIAALSWMWAKAHKPDERRGGATHGDRPVRLHAMMPNAHVLT